MNPQVGVWLKNESPQTAWSLISTKPFYKLKRGGPERACRWPKATQHARSSSYHPISAPVQGKDRACLTDMETQARGTPHFSPSTKYVKAPGHYMIPNRKFLQRQGEIFPPNLFTFQISVAITTRHNYLCEIFAFQVLPSSTLCGEFNSALSITTHFFNQFWVWDIFFYKHT